MAPPSDKKGLPNIFEHEDRIRTIEKEFVRWLPEKGRIMRELSTLQEKVKDLTEANKTRAAMDSSADFSIRPGRIGISLKRMPPWAVVAIILVALILVASVIALQAM